MFVHADCRRRLMSPCLRCPRLPTPKFQPPPMTAEAKAERREAALRAAESRTKDWDKRLNKGRQASQTKSGTGGVRAAMFNDAMRCIPACVGIFSLWFCSCPPRHEIVGLGCVITAWAHRTDVVAVFCWWYGYFFVLRCLVRLPPNEIDEASERKSLEKQAATSIHSVFFFFLCTPRSSESGVPIPRCPRHRSSPEFAFLSMGST